MRTSVSALAAILGCAQLAAAAPISESAQNARIAKDAFYNCAAMTVPEYDDRISPANVVAKALAFKCQSWVDAMVKHAPRTETNDVYKEIMRGEEGNLLGIVLRHRVLKSAPAPTPAPIAAASAAPAPAAPSARTLRPSTARNAPAQR